MDSEKLQELIKDMKTGERARVYFDALMELLGGEPTWSKGQFFEAMKEVLEKEQKAMAILIPESPNMFRKVAKGAKKEIIEDEETPKDPNQLELFEYPDERPELG